MIGYGANAYDGLGFEVVTFALSGEDLWKGLEVTLGDIETDDELFMQVSSNLKYYYDPSEPPGSRLKAVYFNGLPIDPTAVYTIGTNWMVKQYLDMLNAMYGLGMTVLNYSELHFGEFGLVFDYVANQQVLGGHLTPGRIVAVAPMTAKNNTAPPPMVKIVSTGPNPFTDNSTVVVEAAEAAPLQVKVYDIMGREVAVLADGYVQAGLHSAVFNANTLPAGMYFCRLFMLDGSVQTVKMLKVR
jgi:hypothetical protein